MSAFYAKSRSSVVLSLLLALLIGGCASSRPGASQGSENKPAMESNADSLRSPQDFSRDVPNSISDEIPDHFYQAVDNDTRSWSGKPGPDYWQQESDYNLKAKILPDQKKIVGHGTIAYANHSPDTLNKIYLELTQNFHRSGVTRNRPAEITGGMHLKSFSYNGHKLTQNTQAGQAGYTVNGTVMAVTLPNALLPGESAKITTDWSFSIPQKGAGGRMGYNSDNLIFMGYWYPKIRVYDDLFGWFTDPFLGNAEFYNEFGNYTVDVTVPEQWLVAGTGTLKNADAVLRKPILNRLQKAHRSDTVMHVVTQKDFGKVTQKGQNGTLTWHFTADDVSDFAFSATRESNWDATRTPVGDTDGDQNYSHIDAFYRNSAPLWKNAAGDAAHAIKFLSQFTGLSYPWPHMTAVEGGGIIGGGMEYPMMTLIGPYKNSEPKNLYAVIAHEFAHMWIPMQLASNERRYAWMDEGTTTFNENQAKKARFPDQPNADLTEFKSYTQITDTDQEGEIMRHSDYHYTGSAYGVASYPKPASVLVTLRGLLGEKTFNKAYHTFMQRWQFKHPYPWDLFNTFEDVSGRDLDWFWRSWYYETWTLDQAVENVTTNEEGTHITIQDLGQIPMPATIKITMADGSTTTRHIKVDTWLEGATSVRINLQPESPVTRVEIDPRHKFPDVNRINNVWRK